MRAVQPEQTSSQARGGSTDAASPRQPEFVDWSGENPGITLKDTVDGETTCLVSFFRVVVSPHGVGHAAFVLTDPMLKGSGEAVNTCFTDNEPLARYLLSDFVSFFGAWRGVPALEQLTYTPADEFHPRGRPVYRLDRAHQRGGRGRDAQLEVAADAVRGRIPEGAVRHRPA